MSLFISASPLPTTGVAVSSSRQPKTTFGCLRQQFGSVFVPGTRATPQNLNLNQSRNRRGHACAAGSGFPGSGEQDSNAVLDAFFLGKAVGEALTERIEASVGEFLSIIGRLQAEQQKHVQELQEDILERAKRAKQQAARDAVESLGIVPSTSAFDAKSVSDVTATAATTMDAPAPISSSNGPANESDPKSSNEGPLIGISNDD